MRDETFKNYRKAHLVEMQTKKIDELAARCRVFQRINDMTPEQRRTLIEDLKSYISQHSPDYFKTFNEMESIQRSFFSL